MHGLQTLKNINAAAEADAFERRQKHEQQLASLGYVKYPLALQDGKFVEDLDVIQSLVGDGRYSWRTDAYGQVWITSSAV